LRGAALKRQLFADRLGLAVLHHQGLAAWVVQWSKLPASKPRAERMTPRALPADTSTQVVHVLAAMALGHLQARAV